MTHRVLALTVAAWVISSAALAKPHCPLGEIYYRSKHACLAKTDIYEFGFLPPRLFNQVRDGFVAFHKAGQTKTTSRT